MVAGGMGSHLTQAFRSSPSAPLLSWTEAGLYCEAGDFHIDPHRPVKRALITHAHSDHARRGSQEYFCTSSSVGLLRVRLGKKIRVQGVPYRERFQLGEVTVSFHSAGHILGSAQIRVERAGEVWVASGDYKRTPDPSCEPFEVVPCETFITEATFGTPKFVWPQGGQPGAEIFEWWMKNQAQAKNSVLFGYSLGKSQRILAELAPFAKQPILIHDTLIELTECYRQEGRILAPTRPVPSPPQKLEGELILAPPSFLSRAPTDERVLQLGDYETAFASGWMAGQESRPHRGSYDRGFVVSDHADWNELNRTIRETGAQRVFVMHRSEGALVRHLRKQGLDAHPVQALEPAQYARLAPINLSLFGSAWENSLGARKGPIESDLLGAQQP
jgi:putative mRNA 3-end processing factor